MCEDTCKSARARVCWYYFANLSTVVCLSAGAHRDTKTHTHTLNTKKKGKYMSSNDRKSTISLKHSISVLSHKKHTHTELGNQPSGILRKANKKKCILVCLCMYMCMRHESESASHSSPPQLKGVRVISACAHRCVCTGTTSLISLTVSVCLHTVTQKHTKATLKAQANTCQVMKETQHFH